MNKIIFSTLILLVTGLGYLKAQNVTTVNDFKPYYEQGMFMGVQSAPIAITTEECMSGEIEVGYSKMKKQEALFLKILPGSPLYNSLDSVVGPILNAKLALMESNPSSGGVFYPNTKVSNVDKMWITLTLEDNTEMYIYGSGTSPLAYNYVNIVLGDDLSYIPFMIMAMPKVMHDKSSGDDGKFKDIEKKGLKSITLSYGDKRYTFPLTFVTPEYIAVMENAYKKKK